MDFGAAAAALAEQVQGSVVAVRTPGGGGAGVVWRSDGVIITNHHVVPGQRAAVTLATGESLVAAVVARDPMSDLAVLQLPSVNLTAARIGNAHALRAGDLVLAVGHPFGIQGAVSMGVVSAALASPRSGHQRELLRADVQLSPGNSGGPLVDARGAVVGINSMFVGGLALAVPSFLAELLLEAMSRRRAA